MSEDLLSPVSPRFQYYPAVATVSSTSAATPVSQKLAAVLSPAAAKQLDDPKAQLALAALSSFYPEENTPKNRRNLRADIGRRAAAVNKNFLDAFGKIDKELAKVEAEVSAMNDCYTDMRKQLDRTNQRTTALSERIESLDNQNKTNLVRQTLVQAFLYRFTLSTAEKQALAIDYAMSSTILGDGFFAALRHLRQIHEDCQVLLATEHQRAGTDIMESIGAQQEAAYENLFRWIQMECRRSMARDTFFGECEVSPTLRKAVKAILERGTLAGPVLEDIANIRRNSISRCFLDALTRGGAGDALSPRAGGGGSYRPIELQAHDPLRYVGDMLAWLHQAVAGEKELLESLLRDAGQDRSNAKVRAAEEAGDEENRASIRDLLDAILEVTCRPLKTRIDQVLAAQSNQLPEETLAGPIVTYKLANLIQFYHTTIRKLAGDSGNLTKTLKDSADASYKLFFDALNVQAGNMLRYVEAPGPDLLPPATIKDVLSQLHQILTSYSTSLLTDPDTAFKQDAMARNTTKSGNLSPIDSNDMLSAILNPILQLCRVSAEKIDAPWTKAIFTVNALGMVQTSLSDFPFALARSRDVEFQIDAHADLLAHELYLQLLDRSNLRDVVQTVLSSAARNDDTADQQPPPPLSTLTGLDARSLTLTLSDLDDFLVSVTVETSTHLSTLVSSRRASDVARRAFRRFVDAYAKVCGAVEDPKNRYEFPGTIVNRSVREMELLLLGDANV